ncbi:MAG: Na(+)-translocating NADH-quinone reductase subunit A [Bacteroidales bacterium]|nr:Na(+)-translocating NADH-quinone reductase subunit A [Bacteroidales bacterium]
MKKGLNIPVKGEAALRVSKTIVPDTVAVRPDDFHGLVPRLLVSEGDKVLCGSPVMADKLHPEILISSPVSGTVKAIVRGEKRKLLAVVVESDTDQQYAEFGAKGVTDAAKVRELILASGLWPFIVERPYGVLANPDIKPKAIFVSAFSTAPLAADTEFAFGAETAAIQAGINAVRTLTDGPVHFSYNAADYATTALNRIENVTAHKFSGKHPAGNVGVQISHISPIRKDETVWTISLAGLAAIGKLFLKGKVDLMRKVAVTGPMAIEPSYICTVPGMPFSCLAPYFGASPEGIRFVSGDPLSGSNAGAGGSLGFFDNQVTLLKEGTEREWFGWIRPLRYKQFSTDHCYFSWLTPWRKYDMDTNLHGGPRAFVMSDPYYAKVLPMDIFPLYLVKACIAGDIDKMEKFGIYEVLPEDLATCEFIDPCKNDIQSIIEKGIEQMRKEMA